MARPTEITPERVAAAADALRAQGIEPTVNALRAELGGSNGTILPYLRLWKERSGPAAGPRITAVLGAEMTASVEAWANAFLALAQKANEALLSAERDARVAAEASADESGAQLESTQALVADLQQAIRQRDDELIAAQGDVNRLHALVAGLEREKGKLQSDLETARREANDAQHRAELAEQHVSLMGNRGSPAHQRPGDAAAI